MCWRRSSVAPERRQLTAAALFLIHVAHLIVFQKAAWSGVCEQLMGARGRAGRHCIQTADGRRGMCRFGGVQDRQGDHTTWSAQHWCTEQSARLGHDQGVNSGGGV